MGIQSRWKFPTSKSSSRRQQQQQQQQQNYWPRSTSILLLFSAVLVIGFFLAFTFAHHGSSGDADVAYADGVKEENVNNNKNKKKEEEEDHDDVVVATSSSSSDWVEKRRYLYWGRRVDCPGKHCDSCEGLGHQESSLRCALEEALFLNRVLVMPSRMCVNPIHNKKGILHPSQDDNTSEERWAANSCAMDSLYDLDRMSKKVHVILDNSKVWYQVLSTAMKLKDGGVAHVEGVSRVELRDNEIYSNALLINRTANLLSWFMECKDRNNRSSVALSYSFFPLMAAKRLKDVADNIKAELGDYDAIHVRRGDKIKTRKDRFGVVRSRHPHLDRDTRPEFIQRRIEKWIPPGRTLFIASNERTSGFFSPLAARYRLAYCSNYSDIIDRVVENNYQLFMIERLLLYGARTFVKTFREEEGDLSLTDDPKKNTKNWQIPVYSIDE